MRKSIAQTFQDSAQALADCGASTDFKREIELSKGIAEKALNGKLTLEELNYGVDTILPYLLPMSRSEMLWVVLREYKEFAENFRGGTHI